MGLDLRPHNHLQHYDMLKDMWVSLAHMPTPRYAATSSLRSPRAVGCQALLQGPASFSIKLGTQVSGVSIYRDPSSIFVLDVSKVHGQAIGC